MKAIMYCVWIIVAFMAGSAIGSCSVPDGDDVAQLAQEVGTPPPDPLVIMVMNINAANWLRGKNRNDAAITAECRYKASNGVADGPWYPTGHSVVTVGQLIVCLLSNPDRIYVECAKSLGDKLVESARLSMNIMLDPVTKLPLADVECRWKFDPFYDPRVMPENATNRQMVTATDVVKAMVAMPAPPPGFIVPEAWLPMLCPLGGSPGWGCPPRPGDIGAGNGASSTGDFR